MKQTVLTTPSGQEILVVEYLPKDATDFYFGAANMLQFSLKDKLKCIDLKLGLQGNWQGKRLEDYTEEEYRELVNAIERQGDLSGKICYPHFYNIANKVKDHHYVKTAKESFYSFLRSKRIDTQNNPFIALNRK